MIDGSWAGSSTRSSKFSMFKTPPIEHLLAAERLLPISEKEEGTEEVEREREII